MTEPWIAAFVALWALVIVLGLLMLGTLRRLLSVIERSEQVIASAGKGLAVGGLSPGASVPSFSAPRIDGAPFTERDFLGSTTIVLFVESGCKACEGLVDDLRRGSVPDLGAPLVVVSDESADARRLGISRNVTVLVDEDRSLARAFDSRVTPRVFVLDEHGTVLTSGTPNDWDGLRRLVAANAKGGDREADVAAAPVAS